MTSEMASHHHELRGSGGTYSLVLRGQSGAPQPKGPQGQPKPPATYPSVPVTIGVQGRETPKKK